MKLGLIFFGSFLHYSSLVLKGLLDDPNITVKAVVTTPPLASKKSLIKNPIQLLAESAHVPVLTPDTLTLQVLENLQSEFGQADYFVTAGYGKLLPLEWLAAPKHKALNLHFSLLPQYRGANPGEWALLLEEQETGITLIEMSPHFDTGVMVAASKYQIAKDETRESLYHNLYSLGQKKLPQWLERYHTQDSGSTDDSNDIFYSKTTPQPSGKYFYAKRLKREDGFCDWSLISRALKGELIPVNDWPQLFQIVAQHSSPIPSFYTLIERATRALKGYPTLWTQIPTSKGEKRMQILEVNQTHDGKFVLEKVQIEGQQAALWKQVRNGVVE